MTLPRSPKPRSVAFIPYVRYFKPAGVPMAALREEVLTMEEFEALRLNDLEGLDQDSCAEKMGISQSTFQRMLAAARFKLVRGLVEGSAIRFEGGRFELAGDRLRCLGCGEEWNDATARAGELSEAPSVEDDEPDGVSPAPVCPRCGRGPLEVAFNRPAGRSQDGPPWGRGYGGLRRRRRR